MNDMITVRDPDIIAAEINEVKRQVQEVVIYASIKIGGKLMEAKSLVSYGEWGKWLEENVEYSQSTANYLMQLYQEYGSNQESLFDTWTKSQTFAKLSYSQHIALLALPFGERQEFAEQNDVENMSTRELQKAIKERDEARRALAESEDKLLDAEAGLEDAKWDLDKAKSRASEAETENKELRAKAEKAQKAQSAAEADLKKLKKKLKKKLSDAEAAAKKAQEEAKKAAENPEVPESVMEQMRRELEAEAAAKAAEDLQKQLETAQKNVDAANRAREEAEQKLAQQQKASTMANPDVAVFKSLVQQVSADFDRLKDVVEKIHADDPATGDQLKNVTLQLLDKLRKEVV